MAKSIVKKKETPLVKKNYYEDFKVDSEDLLIPRIMLMQKVSKKVEEEEAKVGEFRDNVENKLFGDKKTNLIIAPVMPIKKIWCVSVKDNQENVVSYREIPYDQTLPEQEVVEEGKLERVKALQLFCLPMDELEANVKADAKPIPYVMVFKSSSYYAGRQVYQTQFQNKNLNIPPFARAIEISSNQATSKKGGHTFYKMEVKKTEEITDIKKLALLDSLYDDLASVNVKIAENQPEEFF